MVKSTVWLLFHVAILKKFKEDVVMVESLGTDMDSQGYGLEALAEGGSIVTLVTDNCPDEGCNTTQARNLTTGQLIEAVDFLVDSNPRSKSLHGIDNLIDNLYDVISKKLQISANAVEIEQKEERDYESLLLARERLVSLALGLPVTGLQDVKNKLNFWYKMAVSEISADDLSQADHLIISVQEFLSDKSEAAA